VSLALARHLRRGGTMIGRPNVPVPLRVEIQPKNLTGSVNLFDGPIHSARHGGMFYQAIERLHRDVAMAAQFRRTLQPTFQLPLAQRQELAALTALTVVHGQRHSSTERSGSDRCHGAHDCVEFRDRRPDRHQVGRPSHRGGDGLGGHEHAFGRLEGLPRDLDDLVHHGVGRRKRRVHGAEGSTP
jgi:hypothetical protein